MGLRAWGPGPWEWGGGGGAGPWDLEGPGPEGLGAWGALGLGAQRPGPWDLGDLGPGGLGGVGLDIQPELGPGAWARMSCAWAVGLSPVFPAVSIESLLFTCAVGGQGIAKVSSEASRGEGETRPAGGRLV